MWRLVHPLLQAGWCRGLDEKSLRHLETQHTTSCGMSVIRPNIYKPHLIASRRLAPAGCQYHGPAGVPFLRTANAGQTAIPLLDCELPVRSLSTIPVFSNYGAQYIVDGGLSTAAIFGQIHVQAIVMLGCFTRLEVCDYLMGTMRPTCFCLCLLMILFFLKKTC